MRRTVYVVYITLFSLIILSGFAVQKPFFAHAQQNDFPVLQKDQPVSQNDTPKTQNDAPKTQNDTPQNSTTITPPYQSKWDLCGLVNAVIDVVVSIGTVIATLFIIWSGFLFLTAQGKPEALKKARMALFTTLIGTAILVGASFMTKIIFNTVSALVIIPGGFCSGQIQ